MSEYNEQHDYFKRGGFRYYPMDLSLKDKIEKLQAENKILRDTMEDCLMFSQCLTTREMVRLALEKIKQGKGE